MMTEEMLVDSFVGLLATDQTPWGRVRFTREFDYSRGRTDVVAVESNGDLIAIEAKLTDWKNALHQAYRNTCFAHRSFVLLPESSAVNAMRFEAEFEKRGVGLCYIQGANLVILRDSPASEPLEPWLSSEAVEQVHQN